MTEELTPFEAAWEDAPELDDWESITETEEEDWYSHPSLPPAQRSPSLLQSRRNLLRMEMTLSNFWKASEPKLTAPEFSEVLRIIQINKGLNSDLAEKLEKLKPQICKD